LTNPSPRRSSRSSVRKTGGGQAPTGIPALLLQETRREIRQLQGHTQPSQHTRDVLRLSCESVRLRRRRGCLRSVVGVGLSAVPLLHRSAGFARWFVALRAPSVRAVVHRRRLSRGYHRWCDPVLPRQKTECNRFGVPPGDRDDSAARYLLHVLALAGRYGHGEGLPAPRGLGEPVR